MSTPISDRDDRDRDRDLRHPSPPSPPRLGALRIAVGTSVVVHSALVMAAVLLPAYAPAEISAPMVMVDVVAEPPMPEIVPPPDPPAAPASPIVAPRPAPRPPVAVKPRPVVEPSPAEQPPAAAPAAVPADVAPVVAAAPDQTAGDGPAVLVAMAPTGLTGGRASGHGAGDLGPRPQAPPLSDAQRTSMIGRYRELLRGRIRDGFRYPAEARELELTGQVVVQVTIDKGGRLLGARLRGACPHPLLCDDALRTVRAAAPFSALPRDLGDSLQIEIPLNYSFE